MKRRGLDHPDQLPPHLRWLYGLQAFGAKLGLANVSRLIRAMGLERRLRGRRIAQVAGTNGKGSVCAFAASLARAAGCRAGVFSSPHLVRFHERIRVDGAEIPDAAAAAGIARLRALCAGWDPHPTFFESTLALALEWFCAQDCDPIILEVGLGGRLDATSAPEIPVSASAIASIGLDHEQWLGDSLAEIAGEKAAIIRPGIPVVAAAQGPATVEVIAGAAQERAAPLRWIGPESPEWRVASAAAPLALAGGHQIGNAALALALARAGGWAGADPTAALQDLGVWRHRGRFERLAWPGGGEIVVDGAHNPDGARALAAAWRRDFGAAKAELVFACARRKDAAAIFAELAPIARRAWLCDPGSPGMASPGELCAAVAGVAAGVALEEEADPRRAVGRALAAAGDGGRILCAGSLFLAGRMIALAEGAPWQASEQ